MDNNPGNKQPTQKIYRLFHKGVKLFIRTCSIGYGHVVELLYNFNYSIKLSLWDRHLFMHRICEGGKTFKEWKYFNFVFTSGIVSYFSRNIIFCN